jgi:hypothetical protein
VGHLALNVQLEVIVLEILVLLHLLELMLTVKKRQVATPIAFAQKELKL